MKSVFNSWIFWSPACTPTDRTDTPSQTLVMRCVAPCKCATKICLGDETQTPLVCAICKSPGKLTVRDTNSDGFVCKNPDCQSDLRTLGNMLGAEITQMCPIEFIISIVRNSKTGEFEIENTAPGHRIVINSI